MNKFLAKRFYIKDYTRSQNLQQDPSIYPADPKKSTEAEMLEYLREQRWTLSIALKNVQKSAYLHKASMNKKEAGLKRSIKRYDWAIKQLQK